MNCYYISGTIYIGDFPQLKSNDSPTSHSASGVAFSMFRLNRTSDRLAAHLNILVCLPNGALMLPSFFFLFCFVLFFFYKPTSADASICFMAICVVRTNIHNAQIFLIFFFLAQNHLALFKDRFPKKILWKRANIRRLFCETKGSFFFTLTENNFRFLG